jgi:hypothetical protein
MKAKLALAGWWRKSENYHRGQGRISPRAPRPYRKIEQLDATAAQLQKMGIKAIRLKVKKGEAG